MCAGSSKSVDPILHCMFSRHENELKEDHFFRYNLVIKTGMFTWLSRVKYDTLSNVIHAAKFPIMIATIGENVEIIEKPLSSDRSDNDR